MAVVKIRIIFTKKDLMRFISHLDLMRLFYRAVRRADLPVAFTEGFNPHPRISVKRALKLGVSSESEEAVFCLENEMDPGRFRERLELQMPEGIRVNGAELTER